LLLEHLRPFLSHDKKEIHLKITDKSQKAGLRTKNIYLAGFPAVVFCSAGLKIDEQESTRFLLLSPETTQEKIREAVLEKIKKESNINSYRQLLESDPKRKLLKERIVAIKQESIKEIRIDNPEKVEKMFFRKARTLKPRHQRDIGRVISLIKVFALVNLWFRKRDNFTLIANDEDIEEAFRVWNSISESQELNLPPYIYYLYKEVILLAYREKQKLPADTFEEVLTNLGLSRQEIQQKHYEVYGRLLPDWQLRQQILPMLESAGLITQEPDPTDRRRYLVYPTKKYSELDGGVKEKEDE
jgi:hypothetical protein